MIFDHFACCFSIILPSEGVVSHDLVVSQTVFGKKKSPKENGGESKGIIGEIKCLGPLSARLVPDMAILAFLGSRIDVFFFKNIRVFSGGGTFKWGGGLP